MASEIRNDDNREPTQNTKNNNIILFHLTFKKKKKMLADFVLHLQSVAITTAYQCTVENRLNA